MRVLFVTTELFPFIKTGGLGDVAASLASALKKEGADVRILMPGYSEILSCLKDPTIIQEWTTIMNTSNASLFLGRIFPDILAYVIDAPGYYKRKGIYMDDDGKDWPDNHLRFGLLSRIAADLHKLDISWRPDIVHCHDWPGSLAPAYLLRHHGIKPSSILTIHNIRYHGAFSMPSVLQLDLPESIVSNTRDEQHVNFLKLGITYADRLTTVSPTYAKEIQTDAYGCGLEGLLRGRSADLTGILNGMDESTWDPCNDKKIDFHYDENSLEKKKKNKSALIEELGLRLSSCAPVFSVISRLSQEKGLDMLRRAIWPLLRNGTGLIVLGVGDRKLEREFTRMTKLWHGQVSFQNSFSENLAHRIVAGSDAIILPSRTEPCGLVQMYAQRYGTLPVVRRTGGLADSVDDDCGFIFDHCDSKNLHKALVRAWNAFKTPRQWEWMQKNAMKRKFCRSRAAREYMNVYRSTLNRTHKSRNRKKAHAYLYRENA